jgi:hypothetical protein
MIKEINAGVYAHGVNNGVPCWDLQYTYYLGLYKDKEKFYVEKGVIVDSELMRVGYFLCDTREDVKFIQEYEITEALILSYNRKQKMEKIELQNGK